MAARIGANAADDFSGALVIVSPKGRVVIEILSLDPSADESAFWALAKAKVDAATSEFLQREQAAAAPGWPRR